MIRVATLAQQSLLLYQTLTNQSRLHDLNVQLATDKVAQRYSGIAAEAASLVSIETGKARTEQFAANIATADRRLAFMDLSLEEIDKLARQARATFSSALNNPAPYQNNLSQTAADLRLMVRELLNARDGERFLFGGARTDRPPVSFDPSTYAPVGLIEADGTTIDSAFYESYYTDVMGNTLPFAQGSFYEQIFFDKNGVAPAGPLPGDLDNPTVSEFTAEDPDLWQYYVDRLDSPEMLANPTLDYYQGDDQAQVVRADENLEVSHDVRADATAFQQILTALDAVANLPNADPSDPFQAAIIEKAHDMIANALEREPGSDVEVLDGLRVQLGSARDVLTRTAKQHETAAAYADGLIAEIEGIDRTEVIVKLQDQQRVLEASYAVLSRIQSLSLLNYL